MHFDSPLSCIVQFLYSALQLDHSPRFSPSFVYDSTAQGRALLKSIGGCDNVLDGAKELHSYVASSKASSPVNGYMIHSRHISSRRNVIIFWSTHLKIIEQLASKRRLSHVVIQIHPSTDTNIVKKFLLQLQKLGSGWHVTQMDANCPDFGDSVASSITFSVAINKSTSSNVSAHTFAPPPTVTPSSNFSQFLRPIRNKPLHASINMLQSDSTTCIVPLILKISPLVQVFTHWIIFARPLSKETPTCSTNHLELR